MILTLIIHFFSGLSFFSSFAQDLGNNPYPRDDEGQPRDDCHDENDQDAKAFRQNRTGLPECICDRCEHACAAD